MYNRKISLESLENEESRFRYNLFQYVPHNVVIMASSWFMQFNEYMFNCLYQVAGATRAILGIRTHTLQLLCREETVLITIICSREHVCLNSCGKMAHSRFSDARSTVQTKL